MDFTQQEVEIYKLEPGDLLIAEASGSPSHVGRAALWEGQITDCCYQNSVIRYRPKMTHPSYALAIFRHYAASGMFTKVARGVNILHLGVNRFERMPFPLPPYAEQIRIARELDVRTAELAQAESHLRSAVSNIHRQIHEILSLASSGKLLPPGSITGEDLATPSPDHQAPADIPYEIPEEWSWVRLDSIGDVTIGRQRHNRETDASIIAPYLRVANVQEGYIDTTDVLEMPFTEQEYRHYLLKSGDILVNEGQSPELVGRAAIVRDDIEGACFQNSLIRFRAGHLVMPEYALLVFRHYLHSGEFRKIARWTTNIAHLSRTRFAAMSFPLPPLSQQRKIVNEALARLSAAQEQQVSVTSSLKNISRMREELYAAAASGTLCDQQENDESASVLLSRSAEGQQSLLDDYAAEKASKPSTERPLSRYSKENGSGMEQSVASKTNRTFAEVIAVIGRPVSLTELYRLCGYDQDSVADIERFYLQLKDELDRSVRRHSGEGEDILLEVIHDATA
jgi:type I restriction enzyme S subunit